MVLATVLASLLSLPSPAYAAECCGSVSHWDEPHVWGLRYQLCMNPWGGKPVEGGYEYSIELWDAGNIAGNDRTYTLWARHADDGKFPHCWEAVENMITQCTRNGYAFSSWAWGGEEYALAVPGSYTSQRRSLQDAPELPAGASFEEIEALPSGVYNVNGTAINIVFEDTLSSLPTNDVPSNGSYVGEDANSYLTRRDEGLQTTYGTTHTWNVTHSLDVDLAAIIAAGVAQFAAEEEEPQSLAKRGEVCRIKGDKTNQQQWVTTYIGEWRQPWRAASGCFDVGLHQPGFKGVTYSQTYTESFSVGLSVGIKNAIAEVALQFGKTWTKSFTQGATIGCWWDYGACHVLWVEQHMIFQRGFLITYSWDYGIMATVKLVHADAPADDATPGCLSGCCETCASNLPNGHMRQVNPNACYDWAGGKESYYAVCNNWDYNPAWGYEGCRA